MSEGLEIYVERGKLEVFRELGVGRVEGRRRRKIVTVIFFLSKAKKLVKIVIKFNETPKL